MCYIDRERRPDGGRPPAVSLILKAFVSLLQTQLLLQCESWPLKGSKLCFNGNLKNSFKKCEKYFSVDLVIGCLINLNTMLSQWAGFVTYTWRQTLIIIAFQSNCLSNRRLEASVSKTKTLPVSEKWSCTSMESISSSHLSTSPEFQ